VRSAAIEKLPFAEASVHPDAAPIGSIVDAALYIVVVATRGTYEIIGGVGANVTVAVVGACVTVEQLAAADGREMATCT
jgi:hypothetical protein